MRAGWTIAIRCRSDVQFAFGVSLVWLALYNISFWEQTLRAMWSPSLGTGVFILSVFVLTWCLQAVLLLLMPTRLIMRTAASALFVVAAFSSYFINAYGVVMSTDMLRNAMQTDPLEVAGLVNIDLVFHVLVFGVFPAVLVWKVELPTSTARRQLRQRVLSTAVAIALCAVGVAGCSANYAVYLRAHKPIRYTLSPVAAVVSAARLAAEPRPDSDLPLQDPGGLARRISPSHPKPLALFIVVGETARASNFQLGGYNRATTPELASMRDIVYFSNATACGASTAISVPCMFSHLGRGQFKVDEAGGYTNVLDSLVDAGFDVEWRDNNAGCKGVCARVRTIEYSSRSDPSLCEESYCHDEVMLQDLPERLRSLTRDTVIVFHQIGSHGPAYAQRYPAAFERFEPACRSNELQHCSTQELVNAYDNTIAYTDAVLSRQIDMLRAAADHVDSILIYASDHGESLGEQGLYLHGMPYTFAPRVQKEVPMLLWMSPGYAQREHVDLHCLQAHSRDAVSHDVLYHTILGAAETRDGVYDPRLDVLATCRSDALLSDVAATP
ncbi:MAG TPA: phosphoethanolamine--lipid A transferase [Steroidobacteraceae bacterium]|nr:phosphoethanolamine--lipid A transferase [Steroidobacteraceae bacterium]